MLPSAKIPRALNWAAVFCATFEFAGVILSDVRVDDVTSKLVVPLMEPNFAVMFAFPCPWAVACPVEVMVATAGLEVDHAALSVMFWVVLSLNRAVAW